ncbi:unnamed protein product [Phytophthora fragariaefolia]|uniref:Unnamed protein product n=1 Tax=Phytophthora fragariaefolia TaxID=1490495 RepID=A0A9W6TVD7_9STRA|nr:unnamed protein product [Phytophthora fragariaefolia]
MGQNSLCMLLGSHQAHHRDTGRPEEALALNGYAPVWTSWPSPTRQVELATMMEAREPLLKHTFGFIEKKNFRLRYIHEIVAHYDESYTLTTIALKVQLPSIADLPNSMDIGWLHTIFVTGTVCFTADGCIIWTKHNYPGSWNDSNTS